jgi:hypothetical protein
VATAERDKIAGERLHPKVANWRFWGATISVSGLTTIRMAGGEELKAA